MKTLHPDIDIRFYLTVLDISSYETEYDSHIKLLKNENRDELFLLLNEIESELKSLENPKQTYYFNFMKNYSGMKTTVELMFKTYNSNILESIEYIRANLGSPNWKQNIEVASFISYLLNRDCLALFRKEWYTRPDYVISKELSEYVFTQEEYEYLFHWNTGKFQSEDFSKGFLSDFFVDDKYELLFPYSVMDDGTVKEINKKFEQKSIPEDKLLREEFLFYREIFKKATIKEWIVLINPIY